MAAETTPFEPSRGPGPHVAGWPDVSASSATLLGAGQDPSGVERPGPFLFSNGALAGRTLRCELTELQAGMMCRKSGKRDRRTVDPCPVITLSLFDVLTAPDGAQHEHEVPDYSDLGGTSSGFVCHVDIFPVPGTDLSLPVTISPVTTPAEGAAPMQLAVAGRHIVLEESKCTRDLGGATFAQASTITWKQGLTIAFIFSDIGIHCDGVYLPRYRCFNVLNGMDGPPGERPVLAEVYGSLFRSYPAKLAPRLPPTTELTNHLAKMGCPVKVRGVDGRKTRAKRGASTKSKRRAPASESGSNEEDDSR